MNIVAQDFLVRVAVCGHEYKLPIGTTGRKRNYCDDCKPAPMLLDVRAGDTPDGRRKCFGCGDMFRFGPRDRNPRKWCSDACRLKAHRQLNPEAVERNARLAAERHMRRYVKASHELECVVCRESFQSGNSSRLYCGRVCSNKAYADRRRADGRAAEMSAARRALEVGAPITPGRRLEVLDADDWVCHLCLKPTNREAVYPAPDYPVADHVVPLAKGGVHAPSNWRTAHSRCNGLKSDMSLEEFWLKHPIVEVD